MRKPKRKQAKKATASNTAKVTKITTGSDRIKAQLLSIRSKEDGMIHARDVVAWADSHRESDLGRKFEWDNDKAAYEYRLYQARRLIMIHIVDEEHEPQIVNLKWDRPRGGGYRMVDEVLDDLTFSRRMYLDAKAELLRVRSRYERVRELVSVWEELDRVDSRLQPSEAEDRPEA